MRAVAPLVVALLLTACGGGDEPDALPGGPSSERLTLRPLGSIDKAPSGYAEYLPPGYGDGKPRPLLLFFHGAGENGDGKEELEFLFATAIPKLIRSERWPE
jgi:poly(3-hydroxybutyrate) depolymerase